MIAGGGFFETSVMPYGLSYQLKQQCVRQKHGPKFLDGICGRVLLRLDAHGALITVS